MQLFFFMDSERRKRLSFRVDAIRQLLSRFECIFTWRGKTIVVSNEHSCYGCHSCPVPPDPLDFVIPPFPL